MTIRVTAVVRNGRLLVDEATDLPEGSIVELALIERNELDQDDSLEEAYAEQSISQVTSRKALADKLRK